MCRSQRFLKYINAEVPRLAPRRQFAVGALIGTPLLSAAFNRHQNRLILHGPGAGKWKLRVPSISGVRPGLGLVSKGGIAMRRSWFVIGPGLASVAVLAAASFGFGDSPRRKPTATIVHTPDGKGPHR